MSQPGCELHLRGVSLINLQPAASASVSRNSMAAVLGNFTSLLWFFNINRTDTLEYAPRSASPSIQGNVSTESGVGLLGRIVLSDVVLLLPRIELQALRILISNNASSLGLLEEYYTAEALQLLRLQVQAGNYSVATGSKRGNVLLVEGDIDLSHYQHQNISNNTQDDDGALPGDILFSSLNW